jgi:SIR2-like domain
MKSDHDFKECPVTTTDGEQSNFEEELKAHLDGFPTAPFLFVGSGFTRRYASTPDWIGLLREFAVHTSRLYERYASDANGELPRIASLIGEDFRDVWWESDEFEESRAAHPTPSSRLSPLKIEVARRFADVTGELPTEGALNDELEALRVAVVEGIITTNYDTILEYVFADFTVYVGQDQLLFKDPFGVAEIYKIHGSASDPESLVLTAEDYDRFDERNPYLAAKLLSLFVEHPIVFLGYSMSDKNVRQIVTSIASVLTADNLDRLADRLIFVNWSPGVEPTLALGNFDVGTTVIPVRYATVPDYLGVFSVLGRLKRRFPARILRYLREEVYELVRTSEPSATVMVADLESDSDISEIDVVIGVGVQKRLDESERLSSKGLTGLKRRDLLDDVLNPTLDVADYPRIVRDVLPIVGPPRTHAPVFRYLRGAGFLTDEGAVLDGAEVPKSVRAKARLGIRPLRNKGYFAERAAKLWEQYHDLKTLIETARLTDALLVIPNPDPDAVDPVVLKDFLIDNRNVLDEGKLTDATQWVKCVCLYDYLANQTKAPK